MGDILGPEKTPEVFPLETVRIGLTGELRQFQLCTLRGVQSGGEGSHAGLNREATTACTSATLISPAVSPASFFASRRGEST